MRRVVFSVVPAIVVLMASVGLWLFFHRPSVELVVVDPGEATDGAQGERSGSAGLVDPSNLVPALRVKDVRGVEAPEREECFVRVISEAGQPIVGAAVSAADCVAGALADSRLPATDEAGEVRVPDFETPYWVGVTCEGWMPTLVPSAAEVTALEVLLMRPRLLRVHVTDLRGEPIQHADVALCSVRGKEVEAAAPEGSTVGPRFVEQFHPHKRTDEHGEVWFDVSPSRSYTLTVEKSLYRPYHEMVGSIRVDSDWQVALPGLLAAGVEWVDPETGEALVGRCGLSGVISMWRDARSLSGSVIHEARAEFFRWVGQPGGNANIVEGLGYERTGCAQPTFEVTRSMEEGETHAIPAKPLSTVGPDDLVRLPGLYSNRDVGTLRLSFVDAEGRPAIPLSRWLLTLEGTCFVARPPIWNESECELRVPKGTWTLRGLIHSHESCGFQSQRVEVFPGGESRMEVRVNAGSELTVRVQDRFGACLRGWSVIVESPLNTRSSSFRCGEQGLEEAVHLHLKPGEYRCTVMQWGFLPSVSTIQVEDDARETVTFTLTEFSPAELERAMDEWKREPWRERNAR